MRFILCRSVFIDSVLASCLLLTPAARGGQDTFFAPKLAQANTNLASDLSATSTPTPSPASVPNDYLLGGGDTLTLWVMSAEEINGKTFVVDPGGSIDLPMVGRLQVAGKTVAQVKETVLGKLKLYYRDPQLSLSVSEFRSQPVSVLGQVRQPGSHQLQGGKNLLEVIALAGGLQQDASNTAVITRRSSWGTIPVAGSTETTDSQYFVARVNLRDLEQGVHPEANIRMYPNDVIEIPKAKLIYVMGQVAKPGGYTLNDAENISALQAISMAGGTSQFSDTKSATILRAVAGSKDRQQIPVNLRKILEGQSEDSVLRPDDILYVPGNLAKNASIRALEAGIQVGTGLIIWRR